MDVQKTDPMISPAVLLAQLQNLCLNLTPSASGDLDGQLDWAAGLPQNIGTNTASLGLGSVEGLHPSMLAAQYQHSQIHSGLGSTKRSSGSGNGSSNGRVRRNDEQVRRTVYIADVDSQVTEQQLAAFFMGCGSIVDCRICGDPNSSLRFAFIEFQLEDCARIALSRNGATLGASAIRVSPSKTAILPVNNQFLPRSEDERMAVARTVYVANIHKAVDRDSLRAFFQKLCGPVGKVRLLGDAQHETKIAFVEFTTPEGAAAALRCTGALVGALPIRVSPSKTPVRAETRRGRDVRGPGMQAPSIPGLSSSMPNLGLLSGIGSSASSPSPSQSLGLGSSLDVQLLQMGVYPAPGPAFGPG